MNLIEPSKFIANILFFIMPLLALERGFSANIEDIRIWQAPDHTRLVFDLSDEASYQLFTLESPDRVVVDFKDTVLVGDLSVLDFSNTAVKNIRSGIRDNNDVRLVIDLDDKARPSSFTLEPNVDLGHRLVVDLYSSGLSTNASDNDFHPLYSESLEDRRDIVVAISAGHGGEDPGSIGFDGKIKEKSITLAISRLLKKQLDSIPGYRTVMVRDGDYYVELRRRPQIAREKRADLFVAIHADWYRNQRANGVTIYALSGDRADRENTRRVMEKENGSDLLGGVGGNLAINTFEDDVALTLVSFQMAWSMEQSQVVGTKILESLDRVTRLRRKKVQQASFQVLNSPDIPSVLIETGYLTNPEEARRLNSPSFQRSMAQAIAQGVMNYFYEASPKGTFIAWQKENGLTPIRYVVEKGDSLSAIAVKHHSSVAAIKSLNELNSDVIQIGQELRLQGDSTILISEHTIRSGETLSEIAVRYSISLAKLRAANNLSDDKILVGQILKITTI